MTTASIPSFTSQGLLPPGIHTCSRLDLQAIFSFTDRRAHLLQRLDQCTGIMKQCALTGVLLIDGSFVTDKDHPGDIEVTLDVRQEPPEAQDRALLFYVRQHAALKLLDVDWYPTLPDNPSADFTLFFQYAGEKTAAIKRCHPKSPKGIIRLTQW